MSFKFKLNGRRISDALFSTLKRAEKAGLHGRLVSMEATTREDGKEGFVVKFSGGTEKFLYREQGIVSLLERDISLEPLRRKAYAAEQALRRHADQALVAEARKTLREYRRESIKDPESFPPIHWYDVERETLNIVREREARKGGKFLRW